MMVIAAVAGMAGIIAAMAIIAVIVATRMDRVIGRIAIRAGAAVMPGAGRAAGPNGGTDTGFAFAADAWAGGMSGARRFGASCGAEIAPVRMYIVEPQYCVARFMGIASAKGE